MSRLEELRETIERLIADPADCWEQEDRYRVEEVIYDDALWLISQAEEAEKLRERLTELVDTIEKWDGGGAGSSYGTLNDLRLILWRWRHPDRVTKQ